MTLIFTACTSPADEPPNASFNDNLRAENSPSPPELVTAADDPAWVYPANTSGQSCPTSYRAFCDRGDPQPYTVRSERYFNFWPNSGGRRPDIKEEIWWGMALYIPSDFQFGGRFQNGNGHGLTFMQCHGNAGGANPVRGPPGNFFFKYSDDSDPLGDYVYMKVILKGDANGQQPTDYRFEQVVWSPGGNNPDVLHGPRPNLLDYRGEWLRFVFMYNYSWTNPTGYLAAWMSAPGMPDTTLVDSRLPLYNPQLEGWGYGNLNAAAGIRVISNYYGQGTTDLELYNPDLAPPYNAGSRMGEDGHIVAQIRCAEPRPNPTGAGPGDPEYLEVLPPPLLSEPPPPTSSISAAPVIVEQGVLA